MDEHKENSELIFPDEWVHPAEIWTVLFDVMKEEGISHEDAVEINFLMSLVMDRLTKQKMVPFDIFSMLYNDYAKLVESIGKNVVKSRKFMESTVKDLDGAYVNAEVHRQIYNDILYKKIGGEKDEQTEEEP